MLTFKEGAADTAAIALRFGLPIAIAAGYERARTIFDGLKKLRDNLVHRSSQMPHIFGGEGPFVIALRDNPFPELGIWEESERRQNDLVPLLPVLKTLLYRSFQGCVELAAAVQQVTKLPPPVAPGMSLFARGYFNDNLVAAVASGHRRSMLVIAGFPAGRGRLGTFPSKLGDPRRCKFDAKSPFSQRRWPRPERRAKWPP